MPLAAGVQLPADELFGTFNFIFFMIIFAVIKFIEQYVVILPAAAWAAGRDMPQCACSSVSTSVKECTLSFSITRQYLQQSASSATTLEALADSG